MPFKIEGGTTSSSLDLCQTCAMAQITETENGGVYKFCNASNDGREKRITQRVVRCSLYAEKSVPTDIFKTAWTLGKSNKYGIRVLHWPGMNGATSVALSKDPKKWKALYEECEGGDNDE